MKSEQPGNPHLQRVAEIVRTASLLVTCNVCGKLHKPECPLAFDSICPACTGRYAMGSLHMGGSFPLTDSKIEEQVGRVSPGNYGLGYLDGETFIVFYVGRSDSDVNDRLHSWVGVDSRSTRYGPSAKAAYGSHHRHSLPLGTPALHPVGVVVDGGYTHFEFSYAISAKAAFFTECHNYHDFGGSYGLDNERHPWPSEGESWRCPVFSHHHR